MIRINLLPFKRKKKVQVVPPVFIQAGVILVVVILILGGFTFYLMGKVSDLKDEKANKEKKLAELQAKVQEVLNYEKDNETYKRKTDTIKQLKKNQDMPLRLLEEVSALLADGVWLTTLNNTGTGVDVTGYAFTNSDLVVYVQNLKSSKYLADVELLESRQTKFENVSVYQFKLIFKIKDVDIQSTS